MTRAAALATVVVALAACHQTRVVGEPGLDVARRAVRLGPHDKVDLLFMIDDSPSMSPKQAALRQSFPLLVQRIASLSNGGFPASFHIGVVTSDVGAGPETIGGGQCHPGGDGGRLQTTARSSTNAPVNSACANLGFAGGVSFIEWDSLTGNTNLVGVTDLPTAFSCIASVGDAGCGFESPLESVYRALINPPPENAGFLRDDALLVVVLITDEDDCSAPPDTDLFGQSAAAVMSYGVLHSFRCTQFGVECAGHPLDGTRDQGPFDDCVPLPAFAGGKLYDTQRYKTLFLADRAHGGIKDDANDVVLVSIAAPPSPLSVEMTTPCADAPNSVTCPLVAHSCTNPTNPVFIADPAVRLHDVVSAVNTHVEASVCDADDSAVMVAVGDAMAARMRPGCLPGALVDLDAPDCEVTANGVPLHACVVGPPPCWSVQPEATCPPEIDARGVPERERLTVSGVRPGTALEASCMLYVPALH